MPLWHSSGFQSAERLINKSGPAEVRRTTSFQTANPADKLINCYKVSVVSITPQGETGLAQGGDAQGMDRPRGERPRKEWPEKHYQIHSGL